MRKASSSFSTWPLGSSRCIAYVDPSAPVAPEVRSTVCTVGFHRGKSDGSETKAKVSSIGRSTRTLASNAIR